MGLNDDKKNIFTTIGAFTSLLKDEFNKLPKNTNSFPSINNKKDIVPFLIDILKVVVGTDALKTLTGQLLTDFIDNIEPQLKTALKKQLLQYNSNQGLSNVFKNEGYSMPLKNIDVNGKFKTDPNSDSGNLLYDTSVPSFDNTMWQTIVNVGSYVEFGGALMMKYNEASDTITFKENPALGSTIGEFFNSVIDDMVIINKKEFLTKVMDSIYGSVTTNQNKTVEEVYQELQISKLIEQLIDDDDSFVISENDYDSLLQQAEALVNGVVYYDMGCGVIGATLPLSGMTNLISQISGSTDSFAIGNAVEETINESTANVQETADENKETIKDGFFQKLIKIITSILAQSLTTTPQVRMVLAIASAFENNNIVQIGIPKNDMVNFKIFLKCIIKEAMKLINEFIFNLVLSYLTVMLISVTKKITREKINQYLGIIKSLII